MSTPENDNKWVRRSRNFSEGFGFLWKPLCWFLGAGILVFEVVSASFGHKPDPSFILLIGGLVGITFLAPGGGSS